MWLIRIRAKTGKGLIGSVSFALALAFVTALSVSGLTYSIEEALRDGRDTLRVAPASGDIVIVEIDGRSLQKLDEWPWPRRYYASAVKELDRLGAAQIAFDIDFSARSNPQDDALLAAALGDIDRPAILPTFRQFNRVGDGQTITESLPIPALRENSFVASVNVSPSANGRIAFYPNGVTTNGTARPSLANMLARSSGEVDTSFRVDPAIDVHSIPRVPFIDLLEGRVERLSIEGKQVVIGATALELFDRYPTTLFGVQPGVVIQVQAAETLLQDRARSELGQFVPLGIVILAIGGFLLWATRSRRFEPKKARRDGVIFVSALAGGLIIVALVFDQLPLVYVPLTGALSFLAVFSLTSRFLVGVIRLERAQNTDLASKLPNRNAMKKALTRRETAAVAVARLADFGEIVTVLGAENIAPLDRAVARRLQLMAGVEEVYRLDSGVFAWFLGEESATDREERFAAARALFTSPFEIEGERLRLLAHFGSSEGSIEQAEDASELARQRGLTWSANARVLHEETQFRQRLLGELDEALVNGAISVVFQPKLRLRDRVIASSECLVRWNSPQLGQIAPADFIPVLEEKGRIADLTLFVLREAIARQEETVRHGEKIGFSVNVSAQLLSDQDFITSVCDVMEDARAEMADAITLEITESAPLVDSAAARTALERLSDAGARISIDDYGTGQASLNYLQDFPAQEIKLDQSFIRNLAVDRKDFIMVQSTIELARALGFDIVAEGVEDAATLDILCELDCDYAQGWEIGKPVNWEEFVRLLDGRGAVGVAA